MQQRSEQEEPAPQCLPITAPRYYGINDPVANKMLRRVGEMPTLETPEDTSITTL